jgi:hypothetical protein
MGEMEMAEPSASKITLEEFVRVSTSSALDVLRQHEKIGGFKVPPKIWVGIWVDYDRGPGGLGGPLGGAGGVAGGGGQ